jgi:AraC-like DNA-binding protein
MERKRIRVTFLLVHQSQDPRWRAATFELRTLLVHGSCNRAIPLEGTCFAIIKKNQMSHLELSITDIERANQAALIMEQYSKSHFTISQLAEKVMLPEKRLKIVFRQIYGVGLYTYLRQLRMGKAKLLLLEGKPIKVIVLIIGYNNESSFCKAFRREFNETPQAWRKKELKKAG